MSISKKQTAVVDRLADMLLAGLSLTVLGIVLLAVFCRYVLNNSLFWSDELVRYLFVWFTLLGAVVVLREREHIRVEYFVEKMPLRVRRIVEMVMLVGVCLFQGAMIVLGFLWVWSTRGSYTSALQWPLNLLFYAALPCSAILGVWYSLGRLVRGEFTEQETLADEVLQGSSKEGASWES